MKRPGKMLREVLRNVFRPAATTRYPFVKIQMPPKFRGRIQFNPDLCIGCKLCMRDCPSSAINIRKVGEKKFEADIDMARCMYCGQCVDTCPKKALEATPDFELAQLQRGKLKVTYHNEHKDAPAEPATEPAPAPTPKPGDKPGSST